MKVKLSVDGRLYYDTHVFMHEAYIALLLLQKVIINYTTVMLYETKIGYKFKVSVVINILSAVLLIVYNVTLDEIIHKRSLKVR